MSLSTDVVDGVTLLTLDDGKVNALDLGVFAALDEAFHAAADAPAIVLAGREGFFSAGLNTKAMAGLDLDGMTQLLMRFGQTMLRIWTEPRPVVVAATGHAIAGGTVLAMSADHAVAADGEYRWGMTETTIGFTMPQWVLAIARGNVAAHRLDDLILPGTLVTPQQAVEAGYADAVAEPGEVVEAALSRARELAELPRGTYGATKRRLRGEAADRALAGMATDVRAAMATPR